MRIRLKDSREQGKGARYREMTGGRQRCPGERGGSLSDAVGVKARSQSFLPSDPSEHLHSVSLQCQRGTQKQHSRLVGASVTASGLTWLELVPDSIAHRGAG